MFAINSYSHILTFLCTGIRNASCYGLSPQQFQGGSPVFFFVFFFLGVYSHRHCPLLCNVVLELLFALFRIVCWERAVILSSDRM